MKSVKFFIMTAALVGSLFFTGCSSEDADILPPVVTVGEGAPKIIKLIEGTTYHFPVDIQSEAGLKSIVIKDQNENVLLTQTEFENDKKVTELNIDFSQCTKSAILNLTVIVTDNNNKVITTDPFKLMVAYPTLSVALPYDVSSLSESVDIPVTIKRSMINLSKVEFYLGSSTTPIATKTFEDGSQSQFDFTQTINGLSEGENEVIVKVYEEGNNEPSYTNSDDPLIAKYITSENAQYGKMQIINESTNIKYQLTVRKDDAGKVDFVYFNNPGGYDEQAEKVIPGEQRTWYFTYNSDNKIISILGKKTKNDPETGQPTEEEVDYVSYDFQYNDGKLAKVLKNNSEYVTDIKYVGNDIISYIIDGNIYTPKYTTYGSEKLRVDYLDENMTGTQFNTYERMYLNPNYIQELPAVIPGSVVDIPLQFLYNKYLLNYLSWNAWSIKESEDDPNSYVLSSTYKIGDNTWNAFFPVY